MYPRLLSLSGSSSSFLFGPRGTGKTTWLRQNLDALYYFDLLDGQLYSELLAAPERLSHMLDVKRSGLVVIDEIQRIPDLLNEVHRLIEATSLRFVLTGSSARSLRRAGVNLLAGRALTHRMHALVASEVGGEFSLERALQHGMLPTAWTHSEPQRYLRSYVSTYLREEVLQEGLVRRLPTFSRFLELASFSQGSPLNMANIARECGVDRKTIQNYFSILEDLLIGITVPSFTRRARRQVRRHPKFYLFDAGVYRSIRPSGPLDEPEEIEGVALETLVLQHLRALNDYHDAGYEISYWGTRSGLEVDFVLYGAHGILAIEVKRSQHLRGDDMSGLRAFLRDYPQARCILLYGGSRRYFFDTIEVIPITQALPKLADLTEMEPTASS